jgi:hypothetical protein
VVDVEQGEEAPFFRDNPAERSSTGRGGHHLAGGKRLHAVDGVDEERMVAPVKDDDERQRARGGRRQSGCGRDVDDSKSFPPYEGNSTPRGRSSGKRRDPPRAGRFADPVERYGKPLSPGTKGEEISCGHAALPVCAEA